MHKFLLALILLINLTYSIKLLPQVTIHLDSDPYHMWDEPLKLVNSTYGWDKSFKPVFEYHNKTLFNCLNSHEYETIQSSIKQNYPQYYKELEGIQAGFQKYFKQQISMQYLSAWVYFHELDHTDICETRQQQQEQQAFLPQTKRKLEEQKTRHTECSGLLVNTTDGTIIHGRNLDQQPHKSLTNIAVNMTLMKNNETVGYATDIYWFNTGFVTALVPGLISLEENYRHVKVDMDILLDNIRSGIASQVWPFREIVENSQHYKELGFKKIVEFLDKKPSAAPMYNILGGVKDGAIVSKGEYKTKDQFHHVYTLSEDAVDGWFLLQTNFDLWEKDPEDDPRRTIGTKMIKQVGREQVSTRVGLFAIMDSYKLHNDHTVVTGIMEPESGYYQFFGNEGIEQV